MVKGMDSQSTVGGLQEWSVIERSTSMIPFGLSGTFSYEGFLEAPGCTEKVNKTFKCNRRINFLGLTKKQKFLIIIYIFILTFFHNFLVSRFTCKWSNHQSKLSFKAPYSHSEN